MRPGKAKEKAAGREGSERGDADKKNSESKEEKGKEVKEGAKEKAEVKGGKKEGRRSGLGMFMWVVFVLVVALAMAAAYMKRDSIEDFLEGEITRMIFVIYLNSFSFNILFQKKSLRFSPKKSSANSMGRREGNQSTSVPSFS